MTLRASITLIPNIHLLGISVLLSVSKIQAIQCYQKYYHVVYIFHKLFTTLLLTKSDITQKIFLAFISAR